MDGVKVGAIVTWTGVWVASTVGTVEGVAVSANLVSVGTILGLGVGEGAGASVGVSTTTLVVLGVGEEGRDLVGVSTAVLVAMGVGESRAVAAGVGVSSATGVFVGLGVTADGVAVGMGVGVAAPLATTWPFCTVTDWALASVFNTWTSSNRRTVLPSPCATQVIVAKTPEPLGPAALPKLMAPSFTLPFWLSTSGPTGTPERPVLPRKSPKAASVTCRMAGS